MSTVSPSPSDIAALRRDYTQRQFDEKDVAADPILQFTTWFQEALQCKTILEANAMVLSTVSGEGQPHARVMLLKGFDADGFIFFTNYSSSKGSDLAANPRAALTFDWLEQERQVRIEGMVAKLPREGVAAYFQTRPRGSQLGAWASHQSSVVPNRAFLEERLAEAEARFPGDIPPPETWGGYRLTPQMVEFWQGRTNRLHDRIRYRKDGAKWVIERLSP